MQQLSVAHAAEFDNLAALKELYIYVNKYYGDIVNTLDESPTARKMGLGHKLKSIALSVYPQHQNCWISGGNKQKMWFLSWILHEIILYLISFLSYSPTLVLLVKDIQNQSAKLNFSFIKTVWTCGASVFLQLYYFCFNFESYQWRLL